MFVCQYGSHQNKPHQNRIILNFSHMFIEEKKLKNQNLKKRKMPTDHKKCADFEYLNEKLDLITIFAFFEDFRFFFHVFCQKIGQKIFQKKFHLHIWNLWFFCDFSSNFYGNRRKSIFLQRTLYRKKCP